MIGSLADSPSASSDAYALGSLTQVMIATALLLNTRYVVNATLDTQDWQIFNGAYTPLATLADNMAGVHSGDTISDVVTRLTALVQSTFRLKSAPLPIFASGVPDRMSEWTVRMIGAMASSAYGFHLSDLPTWVTFLHQVATTYPTLANVAQAATVAAGTIQHWIDTHTPATGGTTGGAGGGTTGGAAGTTTELTPWLLLGAAGVAALMLRGRGR